MAARPLPPLHVVTDDAVVRSAGFTARATTVLRAGGAQLAFHLRARGAGGRLLFDRARRLRSVAAATGSLLLVNDRVDVALAAGAGGVQIGGRGIPAAAVRRLVGAALVVGASVHSEEEAAAAAMSADFLLVGTLYPTPSHPGRPGAGPERLRALTRFGLPLVGIGGIAPERVSEVRGAGAAGVAVQRAVWSAQDAGAAVEELIESWQNGR